LRVYANLHDAARRGAGRSEEKESIDMSEYMERHAVARLIGAPPVSLCR
jgi:ATP-dependent Clp protease ATP-binding subunit ClpA